MSLDDQAEGRRIRPVTLSKTSLYAEVLSPEDQVFFTALRRAGMLGELNEAELMRIGMVVETPRGERRALDLVSAYYDAAGDPEIAGRRRRADRFFQQRVGDPATAKGLVERLAELSPEIQGVQLERIGGSDDGPLVLRAGDQFVAVLDDYEEETDTAEFDLNVLEQRRGQVPMVTVRGLVRAVNVLLGRAEVSRRLVPLRGDSEREVYVGLEMDAAVTLARSGYLEDTEVVDVIDLASW